MSPRTLIAASLALLAASSLSARPARAAPVRDPDFLALAPEVGEIQNSKEFFIGYDRGTAPFKDLQVFVVVRQLEDPLRKGWYDFEFVGRAAVAEVSAGSAHFVLYKAFKSSELKKGDRIIPTGDPLTLDEMDLLHKEVLGILQRDKELEDLYTGLISFKVGQYVGSLDSTSTLGGAPSDTNAFKKANSYSLRNLGFRWWFFFNPALGMNVEYASGDIPTYSNRKELLESSQTYLNPGLMYRSKFIFIPAVYSATYFINKFTTANPDDYLIGSTYSGVNFGATFYYPYRVQLARLGPLTFAFNNVEAGIGYAPSVQVADEKYSRGTSVVGTQLSLNAGIEFNVGVRGWRFTQDLFIVFEGGRQSYDLSFSGATEGLLPSGQPIPQGVRNTETQTWYGLRLKYNMRDILGELLYGL